MIEKQTKTNKMTLETRKHAVGLIELIGYIKQEGQVIAHCRMSNNKEKELGITLKTWLTLPICKP